MTRRWVAFFSIALAGAGLDLLTKGLAFSHLSAGETTVVVPKLLWIQLATNRGIAWGLFPSRVWAFVSLAAVPLIAWVFLKQKSRGRLELVCGALILAGTMGNGWDRAVLEYVRDFLVIPLIPNFNLADAMLTCSIAVLSLHWILHERRPLRPAGPAEARQPDDGGLGDVGRDHGPRP
ncbi:MAG TPA: signal peptidase II [Planctomycetota bacterium]|nr:signal peptidase II [Planctomycetota bacterium]